MKIGDTADMTPSDVLRAAADKIITDGWLQREIGDTHGHGPVCALGAVIATNVGWHAEDRVLDALRQRTHGLLLSDWNNKPGRTKDEVIELLLTVADELEAP
jgi:hypothetical protein